MNTKMKVHHEVIEPDFSYFKAPVSMITKPFRQIKLQDTYRMITSECIKNETLKLRQITDKQKNREYKAANFPFVTFSGTFSQRKEAFLVKHSGFMVLDFDDLKYVNAVKFNLLTDKFLETQLLFVSPNGNGLKWVIKIDINKELSHGDWFDAVCNYISSTYEIEVDKSGRDVCRVCFLSYDPEACVNPRYVGPGKLNSDFWFTREEFNPHLWLKQKLQRGRSASYRIPKSNTLIQRDVETVLRRIENCQGDLTSDYADWVKLGFAFADEFGEAGRDYFHRVSQFFPRYNPGGCDRQFDICLKSDKGGITIRTFFGMAKDFGVNIRVR